ncbi:MAG: cysteine hydrolase [Chloroflexi bacterium]|nr:cysteine hydrolase [Chloroflexota bacterium]
MSTTAGPRLEHIPAPQNDYTNELTQEIRLDPASTALVIIDMQYATGSRTEGLGKKLAREGKEHFARERFERIEQVVVPNTERLLAFFRGHHLPVVYVVIGSTHPDLLDMPPHMRKLARETNNRVGTRENEIIDELKPLPGELVIRKTTVSAFTSTGIDTTLRAMGVDTLLFTGVSTNMCVDTTARDAADRGYKCLLVEDCCGAAKMAYHEAAIVTFQRLFGRVASCDEVMAELSAALARQPVPAR